LVDSDDPKDARSLSVSGASRPKHRLAQFLKYVWKVYDLPKRIAWLKDNRRRPLIATQDVVRSLLFTAVLRLPSLNALEGQLRRPPFQRLIGRRGRAGKKAFSADTVARVLDSLEHSQLRGLLHGVLAKAERNKVFRLGSGGARRAVALDGWEPFCSYHRHCEHCLVRTIRFKDGREAPQYYHRFVVALLLGRDTEVVLDLEPLRTLDLRRQDGEAVDTHDGEQTAALRLIDRLHETFGRFIDLFVLDALYPSGPVMTRITELGHGAIITVKRETDEPLKEALSLHTQGHSDATAWDDADKKEHIEAWDVDEIETLDTFKGKVRVVGAEVSSERNGQKRTWCAAVIGERTRRLSVETIHRLHRARWHIENTAFNQWAQHWHLNHVYRHTPGAVVAVLLLWCLAFNLMQLFVYKRLRRPRVPTDPCDTLRALVDQMAQELFALSRPVPWLLFDTT
jgi:hypothetical protein